VRVYVPATVDLLREWYAAGALPSTEDGFVAPDASEEAEYAALMSAADASTALRHGAAGRRVVVVADTAAGDGPVPLREWAAVHADLAERGPDADPDEDLGWFGVQEIPDLL
jgi:hypothetical protein